MSAYTPILGDRVRVVLEGEVTFLALSRTGAFDMAASMSDDPTWIDPTRAAVLSVEKLTAPLPTTPGSVIRHSSGSVYVRRQLDGWLNVDTYSAIGDKYFTPADDYTVLFDAGKVIP